MNNDKQEKDKMRITQRKAPVMPKPKWHAPWKLYRVISGDLIKFKNYLNKLNKGHIGWVRAVDVEPGNQWFVTGANDRSVFFKLMKIF